MTAADFCLLSFSTRIAHNQSLKCPALGEKMREAAEKNENIKRILANIKELPGIAASVEAAAEMKSFV